jgi:hypothetical protein
LLGGLLECSGEVQIANLAATEVVWGGSLGRVGGVGVPIRKVVPTDK